jgi:hypothetical protein
MKVIDSPSTSPVSKSTPARSFAQLLKPGAPPKAAKPAPTTAGARPVRPLAKPAPEAAKAAAHSRPIGKASSTTGLATTRARRDARASVAQAGRQHAAAQRTEKVLARAHAHSAQVNREHHDERQDDRVRVALFQEIERDCGGVADQALARPIADVAVPAAAGPSATPSTPREGSGERAEAIAALVERMAVALKAGVPTMSLGLAEGSGAASIEIARTGKGEVAVRITAREGKRGALASDGASIRAALEARGLLVRSLKIG